MDKYKITIDTYNKSALKYQDKFMGMDLYNDSYDYFCTLIEKENAEIFEIACGPGNVTKYLLNKHPDFRITGIDFAPKMIELAKSNNSSGDFFLMDCREIGKLNKTFDAIMCGFCMPYLSKEECTQLIRDASKLLNPGGVLYISTMEGNYESSGFETTSFTGQDKIFIYYHQVDFLTNELKENGFIIKDIQRKDYPEQDGTFSTDLIMIAKKP